MRGVRPIVTIAPGCGQRSTHTEHIVVAARHAVGMITGTSDGGSGRAVGLRTGARLTAGGPAVAPGAVAEAATARGRSHDHSSRRVTPVTGHRLSLIHI